MIEKYGVFWLHLCRCLLNKATLIRRYSVTAFAYLVSKESSTIVDAFNRLSHTLPITTIG